MREHEHFAVDCCRGPPHVQKLAPGSQTPTTNLIIGFNSKTKTPGSQTPTTKLRSTTFSCRDCGLQTPRLRSSICLAFSCLISNNRLPISLFKYRLFGAWNMADDQLIALVQVFHIGDVRDIDKSCAGQILFTHCCDVHSVERLGHNLAIERW